jgi:hypothetical protein
VTRRYQRKGDFIKVVMTLARRIDERILPFNVFLILKLFIDSGEFSSRGGDLLLERFQLRL